MARYGIDCDFARTGELAVATRRGSLTGWRGRAGGGRPRHAARSARRGPGARRGGLTHATWADCGTPDGCATLDPARLAWGLRRACLAAGVRIYEHSPVTAISRDGRGPLPGHAARACSPDRVALATGAFAPLLRRLALPGPGLRLRPDDQAASAAQLASVGWRHRQGVADAGNQFHYYRLTADNRILWGGYDAVYYYGSQITAARDQRPATFRRLASHFFETFPQLDGLRFTHAWGGVIDTCARFCAFYGTAHDGRLAYAAGYTGLGVGASRFGGNVMLDLLGRRADGADRAVHGAPQAGAVPARAGPVRGHPAHPVRAGPRGPARRPPRRSGCAPWTGSAWASTRDGHPAR